MPSIVRDFSRFVILVIKNSERLHKTLHSNVLVFFLLLLITTTGYGYNRTLTFVKDTIQPIEEDTLTDDTSIENTVTYTARDSIVYVEQGRKLFLYGEAYVEYETMNLKAEFIEIDYEKNIMTAYGTKDSTGKKIGMPLFKDGQDEFTSEKMMYNLKTKKGKIYNVLTKQGDLLVLGSEIKKDSTDVVYMKNLKCIPCQYEDARTVFMATKAKVIPNDKIVTGPLYLEIGGVPTPLALPFGFFPNTKRQHSGILLPTYGDSPVLGFFLKDGGFYWGINDKTDMTIRGDIYSTGSWGLRTMNNYNVLYKYTGSLALGYSEFGIGEKEIPQQYSKQKDFSVNWIHNQDNKNNPSVRLSANVNVITSKYNRLNAQNSGQFLNNTLQSNVNFSKTFKTSALSLNARHSQNTSTRQMEISFPELTYVVNRFYPFKKEGRIKQNPLDKLGISYTMEARNSLSGYDSILFKGDVMDKLKYGVRHVVPISTNINVLKYITVSPSVNLSSVMYTKTTGKEWNPVTKTVKIDTITGFKAGYDANFNMPISTKLYMDYIYKSKRIQQVRHILVPTVSYSYRPDYGASHFGFWKEVQYDTLERKQRYSIFENTLFNGPAQGKQNSLSVNLFNTIEAKVRQKTDTGFAYNKIPLLQEMSLNGNYNFAADSFKMSVISLTGRTNLFKFFDVNGRASFDPYAIDSAKTRRVKNYEYNTTGKVARFVNASIAVTASINSETFKRKKTIIGTENTTVNNAMEKKTNEDLDSPVEDENQVPSFNDQQPWNLSLNYVIDFDKPYAKLNQNQTLLVNGDIAVTKYWKLGVTSGYDFVNKNISYTSVNIYRDLRCWEMRVDWIPFGFRKSYSITLNLKTSMLSDIKIPRQRQWVDNFSQSNN